MEKETVAQLVRRMEQDYSSGTTTISKYVTFDMYETLNKIDAYLNSVHISGSTDSIGRDKPFFNISVAASNIWYRATDIDRKNIRIKSPKKSQYVLSFAAQMKVNDWMKKSGFGLYLNEWGRTLARYGSAVTKFVEKDGQLYVNVIPWNRIICDPIDFDSNPKIEVLEFTPAQLKSQSGYDQDMVDELLEALQSREDLAGQKKDNKADYIKVYEVHGELPLSFLTDKEDDEDTFVQQMHVVAFAAKSGRGRKKQYEDFTLYKGKEKQDPYQKDDLIKEDGRTLGIGAVEHLFEAQWMVNHSQKQIKDILDFASLMILQTSDSSLVGRNVLTGLVTGDVLIHAVNQPLTQLNNQANISQIQGFSAQWQSLAREINGISEAMVGQNPPSGTAWRQTEALLAESHSLFELMTENKGLAIEKMFRKYVLPFIKSQLSNTDEISALLDSHGVAQFDSMYIPNEAIRRGNSLIKKQVLSGQIAQAPDLPSLENGIKQELSIYGNNRFLSPSDVPSKTWKEVFKDFEWEVEVDVTGESVDTQNVLTTLTTVLQTVASNPGVLQDPTMKALFVKILEQTGAISAIEIPLNSPAPKMPPTGGGSSSSQPVLQALTQGQAQ